MGVELQGWFVKRPILDGDWTFVIKLLWTHPQTNLRPEPIDAKVTIRQTYTNLHLRLETPESAGDFAASRIVAKDDGTSQVFGVCRNQPRVSVQGRSRIHMGALVLDVIGSPALPSELHGQYWTDRSTSGNIHGERNR